MHERDSYEKGFMTKCAEYGLPYDAAVSLLKAAEGGDPNLQRATEIFKDWLTTEKHTVRLGEVLSGIARKHGVSLEDIRKENNLASNFVKPGQRLRIPRKTAERGCKR